MKKHLLKQKFWEKVNILSGNECWEWLAGKDTNRQLGDLFNVKKTSIGDALMRVRRGIIHG